MHEPKAITSLTNERVKAIRSLEMRKERKATGLFVAEGTSILISARERGVFPKTLIYQKGEAATGSGRDFVAACLSARVEVLEVSAAVMAKLAARDNPQSLMGVYEQRWSPGPDPKAVSPAGLWLALEAVRDPGNLGTIIRTADWFGIEYVFCSESCADAYSPKTVQATMGSLARVKVIEINPAALFSKFEKTPVFAASLRGTSVYELKPVSSGFVLIGSEAHGVSPELDPFVKQHITIPRIGKAESLNAAVAAGIVCSVLCLH
jgi:TrmH family RNA methyltransferase